MKTQTTQLMFVLLCSVALASASVSAQTAANAPKMSRYVAEHGGKPGVFRRDPNVWVLSPEVAQRSGMPMEWASSELKGVAAAAFRREPEGAEADCGFGGNKDACKPVVNCVLELYFDRNTQQLPWREGAPVADFDNRRGSSNYHQTFGGGANPVTGAGSRSSMTAKPPFTDPDSGEGLFWRDAGAKHGMGYHGIIAYDREIHGSFAYLKLYQGCSRGKPKGSGRTIQLVSDGTKDKTAKVYHEIFLPADWEEHTYQEAEKDWQKDHNFYKGVFEGMKSTEGAQK